MFRCDNCGSGYSTRAASSWSACPRCLAREGIKVPLTFELGWRRSTDDGDSSPAAPHPRQHSASPPVAG